MSDRLRIHIGRDAPDAVEVEPRDLTVTDSFQVEVHNHTHPQHVHLAPVDDFGRFASVEAPNHYLDADDLRVLTVDLDEDRPETFHGKLRLVTGYGTETTYIDVSIEQPVEAEESVIVDERLAEPAAPDSEGSELLEIGDGSWPVLVLAAMALLIAVGAILLASDASILIGVLAVALGVGIALFVIFN